MKVRIYYYNTALDNYTIGPVCENLQQARDYAKSQMVRSRLIPYAKMMEYNPRARNGKGDITGVVIEKFTIETGA